MQNLKKTVAAGVVGVALLAGTAGTFATWQNSGIANAGTITTGDLDITAEVRDWWHVTGQGNVASIADVIFVPGTSASTHLRGNVEVLGLTLADVRLESAEWGTLKLDNGFIVNPETGETTNLQVTLGSWNGPDANNNGNYHATLRVTFVRATEAGMYDNDESFDLGDITVTVTQR